MEKGIIIIYTGNGKGKTSAALGAVVRTIGSGGKVAYLQFMKGNVESGERKFFASIAAVDVYTFGVGWYKNQDEKEKQILKAKDGLQKALMLLKSKEYDLIVLDEINYVLDYELLQPEDLIALIEHREKTNLILTGRNAKKEIVEIADTVSEIKEIKHAFRAGIPALKGIDF